MKRSEYIALGAVGLLAVASFWPSGKGTSADAAAEEAADLALAKADGFQTFAFGSVDECKLAENMTPAICEKQFADARSQDVAEAPKFNALAECEGAFGANACRPATFNGAAVFIPALAGVLIARSLSQPGQMSAQALYPAQTGPQACPQGANTPGKPECDGAQQRSSSSGGGGGGGSVAASNSRRYYSTGRGNIIGRTAAALVVDAITPRRASYVAPTARSNVAYRAPISSGLRATPGFGRSIALTSQSASSSTSTVSRGGFGSTSRSFSSGS